jgi:hypothetical protein
MTCGPIVEGASVRGARAVRYADLVDLEVPGKH